MSHQVTIMTRHECSACITAEQVIDRICAELGVEWSAVDVDSDPTWQAEYGDRVPVILLDGEEHGYWSVDEERLRRDLWRALRNG